VIETGTYPTAAGLGEFGLIDAIIRRLGDAATAPAVLLGPGDDAAVIAPRGPVAVSIDQLVEGRHFRRDWSSAADVGVKAVGRSLADVVAMGCRPLAIVAGLALPADLPAAWVTEMAGGMADECRRAGAAVVGGDVTRAAVVALAVTALGDAGDTAPVTRGGARPGDRVVLVGRLGWAAAGWAALAAGAPTIDGALAPVVTAHRRPAVTYDAGPALARLGATAMVDVSDGLLADLGHVAEASGVAIDLQRAALPVAPEVAAAAAALDTDPLPWLLAGGDDHGLVATLPPDALAGVADLAGVVIGTVAAGAAVTVDGDRVPGPPGWRHF
jgi:thiamine-monophosphate kinase